MRGTVIFSFLCSGALLSGCDNVASSEGLPTADIYADLHVVQTQADTVVAQGQLRKGSANSSTYVELNGGDDLIASIALPYGNISISGDLFGQLQDVTHSYRMMTGGPQQGSSDLFFPDYSSVYDVKLPLPDAAQPVYIGLHRDGQISAPDSQAILPPPFELISPQSGETHPANSDLVVIWSNTTLNFAMELTTKLSCTDGWMGVSGQSFALGEDTGSARIRAANLRPSMSSSLCNVTISLDRWHSGTLDMHFAGGRMRGHQIRTATVTVPVQ